MVIKKKLVIKKQYKIAGIVFATFFFLFGVILPVIFNPSEHLDKYQNELIEFINQENEKYQNLPKLSIEGAEKFDVNMIFGSSLKTNNVQVKNFLLEGQLVDLKVGSLKINVSTLALLSGNIKVKSLEFIEPQFQIKKVSSNIKKTYNNISKFSYANLINNYNKEKQADKNSSIFGKIRLTDSTIVFVGNKGNRIDNFSADVLMRDDIFSVLGEGFLNNKKISVDFNLNTKGGKKSNLFINSDLLVVQINGNFQASNIRQLHVADFDGMTNIKITNFKDFYDWFKLGDGSKEVEFKDDMEIFANIKNVGGILNIKDFKINSSVMRGTGSISGNIIKSDPEISVNLDIQEMDLDTMYSARRDIRKRTIAKNVLWTDEVYENHAKKSLQIDSKDLMFENVMELDESVMNENSEAGFFDNMLTRRLNIAFDVNIKKIKYLEDTVSNVVLNGEFYDSGKVKIDEISLKAPGGTRVDFKGYSSYKYKTPLLMGQLVVTGDSLTQVLEWLDLYRFDKDLENLPEKYSLDSSVVFLANDMVKLEDFKLRFDDVEIGGEVKRKRQSGVSYVKSNLYADAIDLDRMYKVKELQFSAISNMREKLLWLNSFDTNVENVIRVKDLKYNNIEYSDFSAHFKYGQGYMNMLDMNVNSKSVSLGGKASVDITTGKPILKTDLVINRLKYKNKQESIADLVFGMPSLGSFVGEVKLKGNDIELNSLTLDNFNFKAPLQFGTLDVKEFKGKAYGGDFEINGVIKLNNNKEFNVVYSASNISINPLLKDALKHEAISGRCSFSGKMRSLGNTKSKFVDNLVFGMSVRAKDVDVKGFGLDKLSQKMLRVYNNINELQDVQSILENKKYSTKFSEVEGNVNASQRRISSALKLKGTGLNGVYKGDLILNPRSEKFGIVSEGLFSFATGTKDATTLLNLAFKETGTLDSILRAYNLIQVESYLDKVREYYEEYRSN